jgi:hypothetical protein
MAQTTVISTKELKRQAELVFEGKTLKVMLCNIGTTGYTEESTVANWQSVEASGNGYATYSTVIGTGSYNTTTGRYELPTINAAFTADGGAISYDRVVIYVNGETYVHSLVTENPSIILVDGQTQTYAIKLAQDD